RIQLPGKNGGDDNEKRAHYQRPAGVRAERPPNGNGLTHYDSTPPSVGGGLSSFARQPSCPAILERSPWKVQSPFR
ncbi:MAG: hypothetical protein NDJ92_19090, partial [Thermoanaerobaculia bacterium]|nr:hypothetical protein [Thermoanaerobaculia bacterium]